MPEMDRRVGKNSGHVPTYPKFDITAAKEVFHGLAQGRPMEETFFDTASSILAIEKIEHGNKN